MPEKNKNVKNCRVYPIVSIHRIATNVSSGKPLCTTLRNIVLHLGFAATWRFLRVGSHLNILWRQIKLRDLGWDAGDSHTLT